MNIQAEGTFRNRIEDINLLQVRNNRGGMVPLGTLVDIREIGGPVFVTRYNLVHGGPHHRQPAAGYQLGGGDRSDREPGRGDSATVDEGGVDRDLMFMQIRAGNTAMYVFAFAVACVFLALAALYESWSLPLAVILVVPLCLLCSVAGVLLHQDSDVNIFVQIGLIVLVGLACKNAILIVEFARELCRGGPTAVRGNQRSVSVAAAADPDDLVRVHSRRGAAGGCSWAPGPRCGTRWGRPSSAACWE